MPELQLMTPNLDLEELSLQLDPMKRTRALSPEPMVRVERIEVVGPMRDLACCAGSRDSA